MKMLTNEQKALRQIISYLHQNKADQLNFYFQIVDSQLFLNPRYAKIFQALKHLTLAKITAPAFAKINYPVGLIAELHLYLQTHFPQEPFDETSLAFLSVDSGAENNLDFLDNLKHTFTQEKLFQQLLKIIRPSFENRDPYHQHLYYQGIFDKLRKFTAFLPHPSDQTLFTIKQMTTHHPEFFASDPQAKQTIQAEYYRLSETFQGLNHATQGFKKGQIITIGGFTGLGKTSFVYNLLLDLTKTKYQETQRHPHLLVFSYEMTLAENLSRLLANITQIPLDVILAKNFTDSSITPPLYLARMKEAHQFLSHLNLTFSYDQGKKIDYILDLVYRLALEQKAEIIVIDHLQITKASNHFENDRLAIDEIMTKLKKLAIELKLVIIILSQFSRDSYSNYFGKSPEITALKGSGGIETNSDLVLIMSEFQSKLHKNQEKPLNIYNQNCNQLYSATPNDEAQKIIELAIKKNRSGTKKTLIYHFAMNTQTFQEIGYLLPYPLETT